MVPLAMSEWILGRAMGIRAFLKMRRGSVWEGRARRRLCLSVTDRCGSVPPLTALPNPEFPSRRTPHHFQAGSESEVSYAVREYSAMFSVVGDWQAPATRVSCGLRKESPAKSR